MTSRASSVSTQFRFSFVSAGLLLSSLWLSSCGGGGAGANGDSAAPIADPPEVQAGERFFLETRFARYFRDHAFERWNEPELAGGGDPALATSEVAAGEAMVGPFLRRSMNCRACHLVDEHALTPNGGFRTYADFARNSPVPDSGDGQTHTPRNSPALVNASLPRAQGLLLHFDGEFSTIEDLVVATMTGRNYGWLAGERSEAVAHIARILRTDDGSDDLAEQFGGLSYRGLLSGGGALTPARQRLPIEYRIDVDTAGDEELVEAVARLVATYLRNLLFTQNDHGAFSASAYDLFLQKNSLPRQPAIGETDLDYSRRLRDEVEALADPVFVDADDGALRHHDHPLRFGPDELRGLEAFLAEADANAEATSGVGNCVRCHPAPNFTDFAFHNTGVSQRDYDGVHGDGAFAELEIPGLDERNADADAWLPPSEGQPDAAGRYRAAPSASTPGFADLGLWNVLGNPSMPKPQSTILDTLCSDDDFDGLDCDAASLLPRSAAFFKTPGLRDLGESGPYMHDGASASIEDVLAHYARFSTLAREGKVRNASVALAGIRISPDDVDALTAFLDALDEDYE